MLHTHEKDGLCYHTAPHFGGGARHAFSTRQGGVSAPPFDSLNLGRAGEDPRENIVKNYEILCAAIGMDTHALVFSKQTHGGTVRTVTAADAGEGLYGKAPAECDALVTDAPEAGLVVFSADCVPILLYDPVRRAVGAAHAGWRGTALGIVKKTAEAMVSLYGCRPADIRAAIGPSIGPCCFETRGDVPAALTEALGEEAASPYMRRDGDVWHIDLKGINALWLKRVGVSDEQVAVLDACTRCTPALYYSHRRDGARRGSLAALIQLA